jgi:hypothetical protein
MTQSERPHSAHCVGQVASGPHLPVKCETTPWCDFPETGARICRSEIAYAVSVRRSIYVIRQTD